MSSDSPDYSRYPHGVFTVLAAILEFPKISCRDGYVHVRTACNDPGNSFWCGVNQESLEEEQ
jgi:hypothetical protein